MPLGRDNSWPETPMRPLWQRMALLALGYFTCAWLGRFLSGDGGTAVNYWLPGGFFVAMLLLNDTRDWPWLMVSIIPANVLFDLMHDPDPQFAVIAWFCFANMAQAGSGAWLVRRFVVKKPELASLRELFGLMVCCGVIGAAVGATIGTTMLSYYHLVGPFWPSLKIRWGGNSMAVLVLAPLVLAFGRRRHQWPAGFFTPWKILEALLIVGGLSAFCWHVLVQDSGITAPKAPAMLFVLWAGLRFGLRGGALAVFLLVLWLAFSTTHALQGLSLADHERSEYVFSLQSYIVVAALVGLAPAIVLGERDRTLSALRESQARFRTLTDAAFEGIFISEDGRILDVNDQGLKMFGYQREEMIGKSIVDLVTPAWKEVVAKSIHSGEESMYGHELLRKDGTVFLGEARAKMVDIDGHRLRMTALRDVTERKRTEQALRESEEKFSKAFRTSPDGMCISDLETGLFIEVNEGYCRLYGYSREEVIGRTSKDLGIWRNATDREAFLDTLKKNGCVRDLELRTHGRAGELRVVHLSAEAMELEGRRCLVSVLHDITDRVQAEEFNESQKLVLEMIASGEPMARTLDTLVRSIEAQFDDMLCSILLMDRDGVHIRHGAAPSLPLEYMKATDGRPIGPCAGSCGTAAFLREPIYVSDIEDNPLWVEYRQFALPHGLRSCWSTPIFDTQRNVLGTFAVYHRRTGLPTERHLRAISMVAHTAAICIGRHRSETEREEAVRREQNARIEYTLQLIASQEAERKRIAAELHDSMGQNLLLIKNLADISLKSSGPEQPNEQMATIAHLATQCISEARQISRDLRPYQLDHLGLKRALEAMLEHTAQASEIQFTFRFEPVDGLFPNDAAMHLYRIVQESLNNILKYSRAKTANISLERDLHEVRLQIRDDGVGFDLSKAGGAKGLGLRNISERVRMLGGKLNIHSEPGHGTHIEVTVPIVEKSGEVS